jgi:hypothetical protein
MYPVVSSQLYPVEQDSGNSRGGNRRELDEVQSLPPLTEALPNLATSSTVTGAVLAAHVVRIIPDTWMGRMSERRTVWSMQCYNLCCKPVCGSNPYACLVVSCWIFVGMCLGFLLAVFAYRCVRESVVNN